MKIKSVRANNRARRLEFTTQRGVHHFPYSKLKPEPSTGNKIMELYVDKELAREGATYRLADGQEQSVLLDEVLHYNQEPSYVRQLLLQRASAVAAKLLSESKLTRRQIASQLHTSTEQVYRLADPDRPNKHLENILALVHVLDGQIELRITPRNRRTESICVSRR